jgi:hypothetical protein
VVARSGPLAPALDGLDEAPLLLGRGSKLAGDMLMSDHIYHLIANSPLENFIIGVMQRSPSVGGLMPVKAEERGSDLKRYL